MPLLLIMYSPKCFHQLTNVRLIRRITKLCWPPNSDLQANDKIPLLLSFFCTGFVLDSHSQITKKKKQKKKKTNDPQTPQFAILQGLIKHLQENHQSNCPPLSSQSCLICACTSIQRSWRHHGKAQHAQIGSQISDPIVHFHRLCSFKRCSR